MATTFWREGNSRFPVQSVVWPPRQQHAHAWQLEKFPDDALVTTAQYRISVSIREKNVGRDHEESDWFSKPGVNYAVVG